MSGNGRLALPSAATAATAATAAATAKLIALSALAYLGLGLAGLALAIPPGYASPIFPAAGFAVAIMLCSGRRAWPGIALGSLLLNLVTGDMTAAARSTTVLAALGIAAGATLQAYVAARLTERVAGSGWRRMEAIGEIAPILIVAGPLSCLTGAGIGVTTLYLNGLTPAAEVLFTAWNWWAGDTLGVLLALPLSLTWLLRQRSPWRKRPVALGLPMLLTVGLIGASYFGVAEWERAEQEAAVRGHGEELAKRLEQRFIGHEEALAALKRLIEVTPDMSWAQFDHFTRITLREHPDIFALSFNPYVRDAERAAVERRMARSTAKADFEIKERDAGRQLVRAGQRADYVVVGYISPLQGNLPAIGYDINSEPLRADAIRRARESRRPGVTAPLTLVQENQKRVGALLLHPAYETTANGDEMAGGGRLAGFAVAVIKLDQMTEIATREARIPGLGFRLTDLAAGPDGLVFQSPGEPLPGAAARRRIALTMADRNWALDVYATASYVSAHRPWTAWVTGVVGLVLAALLQMLLLVTSGRFAASERKLFEKSEELEVQGAELQDRTALITTLFGVSPDGLVAFAFDGTVRLTNPAFHTMTGIGAGEVVGQSIAALDARLRQGAEQPQRYTPLATLFEAGRAAAPRLTLALARPRPVVLQIIGVRSDAASINRFAYFRDITHETEVDRLKSEFVAVAAHELRTPMASIYGFTELLLAQEFSEVERRDLLGTIFGQSERMIAIINELLDLARIEARRGNDFVIVEIDVGELLREVVAGFKTPDGRPSPQLPSAAVALLVRGDRQKLTQALNNVFSNAYKYSPGGGAVSVELVPPQIDPQAPAGGAARRVGIRIRDRGIGMTPEQLARVCERFYRADISGQIPGTGLGMSIVKEIIELHGGELEIASAAGAGSTVTLWLPAAEMPSASSLSGGLPAASIQSAPLHPATAHHETPS